MAAPRVVVLAGPNGAGKSTLAPSLLRDELGVTAFVNADTIAQGMSGFDPHAVGLAAGRIMLRQLKELAAARTEFAFETTLASKSFAPWLRALQARGYEVWILYLWMPSADMAIARVRTRVATGGHDVPDDVVRRRYARGIDNLHRLYAPLADHWRCFDASLQPLRLVARNDAGKLTIVDADTWRRMQP